MPRIHVCSLERLYSTVEKNGASHVVTVIKPGPPISVPSSVRADRHLKLFFSDIETPREGETIATDDHMTRLLAHIDGWDRANPMVVHCYAGVSRSTASAFIAACRLRPDLSERHWANTLREASPTASPNRHLVALADRQLGRQGRMIAAIEAIGRGRDCFEGVPFALEIGQ